MAGSKKRGSKKKTTKHKKIYTKKIPKKYTRRLSRKDKQKQLTNIRKSIRSYKRGVYVDRPKLKSYKQKKSQWVTKFEKKYGSDCKTYKDISKNSDNFSIYEKVTNEKITRFEREQDNLGSV